MKNDDGGATPEKEPEILAFCCNWCAYAGADLAGVSRLKYPENVRIIRVMCTGRVSEGLIMRAFESGFEGVLVAGCHLGECHYINGNEKAIRRVEKLQRLLELLGLGDGRLRFEEISASEGGKFAEVVRRFVDDLKGMPPVTCVVCGGEAAETDVKAEIEKIVGETKAFYCVECGKCTASCPISRFLEDYSPRANVERAVFGLSKEVLSDANIWRCLTCGLCEARCPAGVDYVRFIREMRQLASVAAQNRCPCAHGGVLHGMMRLMAYEDITPRKFDIFDGLKVSRRGEFMYFVGCLPFFDVILDEASPGGVEIARSAVYIMNRLGISPVILEGELCCGHDLLWTGDIEAFQRLAARNVAAMEEAGVRKVIFSCAECYRTFKKDYPELLGDLDFELMHISEFLSEELEKRGVELSLEGVAAAAGAASATAVAAAEEAAAGRETTELRLIYHDPCRLGRHLGVYDAPRRVLSRIKGVRLVEFEDSRESAQCCGTSAWASCDFVSEELRIRRLREARDKASILVTACPKCKTHFRCTQNRKDLPVKPEEINVEVKDFVEVVAAALRGSD